MAEAYARHALNANNRKLARQTLKAHVAKSASHPLSEALLADIDAGKTPPLLVVDPTQGLAEVFYGIGDALAGEGGLEMGIIFLRSDQAGFAALGERANSESACAQLIGAD